jgi:hypothetical protein
MDISKIIAANANRPPVLQVRLSEEMAKFEFGFPRELVDFYRATDGFMMPSGINVYQVEDVFERNKTFEIDVYCKGYLLIGDNSGGRGFLLSLAEGDTKVYSSDLGDLGPEDFDVEAESFTEWLSSVE